MSDTKPLGSWVCVSCGTAFIANGEVPTWAARKCCAEQYEEPAMHISTGKPICGDCVVSVAGPPIFEDYP